jgi:hypothetical protein
MLPWDAFADCCTVPFYGEKNPVGVRLLDRLVADYYESKK